MSKDLDPDKSCKVFEMHPDGSAEDKGTFDNLAAAEAFIAEMKFPKACVVQEVEE